MPDHTKIPDKVTLTYEVRDFDKKCIQETQQNISTTVIEIKKVSIIFSHNYFIVRKVKCLLCKRYALYIDSYIT